MSLPWLCNSFVSQLALYSVKVTGIWVAKAAEWITYNVYKCNLHVKASVDICSKLCMRFLYYLILIWRWKVLFNRSTRSWECVLWLGYLKPMLQTYAIPSVLGIGLRVPSWKPDQCSWGVFLDVTFWSRRACLKWMPADNTVLGRGYPEMDYIREM